MLTAKEKAQQQLDDARQDIRLGTFDRETPHAPEGMATTTRKEEDK